MHYLITALCTVYINKIIVIVQLLLTRNNQSVYNRCWTHIPYVVLYCLHYIMIIQIITCLNLPYERGWCDCFCQLMMHCAGKHWSAHSCIMLTVRRGHTPRYNSPDMIYQGSPHHLVLGANTNIGLGS